MKINVIQNFNGLRGELVETVDRKGVQVRLAEKRGGRGAPQHGVYRVSYKGERYKTFILPKSYGVIAGVCINLRSTPTGE